MTGTSVDDDLRDDGGADDLRDEHLRRALHNAPDHSLAPDWRLRKAILDKAHEAVGVVGDEIDLEPAKAPWWQRMLGLGGGSRMPWNAAFATVLVAVLATVMWQREPVPGARPDAEKVATAPAMPASPAPASTAAPETREAPSSATPSGSLPAGSPETSAAPAPSAGAQSDDAAAGGSQSLEASAENKSASTNTPVAEAATADAGPQLLQLPSTSAMAPPVPTDASTLDSAARASKPSGDARRDAATLARERYDAAAAALALNPAAGPAAPSQRDAARSTRMTSRALADAPLPPVPPLTPQERAAALAAPNPEAPLAALPSFAALSSWSRLTLKKSDTQSIGIPREQGQELGALLGSIAITALKSKALAGAVEWRVSFERGAELLAVLDITRNQVRWREKGLPAATGEPSPAAMAAVRNALQAAAQQQQQQRQSSPTEPAPSAESGAASMAAPSSRSSPPPVEAARAARTPASEPRSGQAAPTASESRGSGAERPTASPAGSQAAPPAAAPSADAVAAPAASPPRRVIKSGIPGVPDIVINSPAAPVPTPSPSPTPTPTAPAAPAPAPPGTEAAPR
ncbi:conserved hypothetical protein [Burkholderiales bacterium 8X]|nr:conserved hypothetical protein [Burkholderiales bacterium 8X]